MPKKACVGIRLGNVHDVATALTQAREAGFDYVCGNIVYDHILKKNLSYGVGNLKEPFSWSDMAISTSEWAVGVVGILSNLEFELEGYDPALMRKAEDSLTQQLNYSQHLGLPAILVEVSRSDPIHLSRILLGKLVQSLSTSVFWVKVPMGADTLHNTEELSPGNTLYIKPWHCWHKIRSLCNHEKKVFPVLELMADVPTEKEIARWLGEPVKAVFISPDVFTTNQKGFPVLSKPHQSIIRRFFGIGAQVVVNASGFNEDLKYYKQYIDFIWNNLREEESGDDNVLANFSRGYEDYLQCPLQPLMDNLESHTYEVFEKDPIKYDLYETAIYEALLTKNEENDSERPLVVMIVGAGRGPLVVASINAASKARRKIRIYAIEKNSNAVNTLLHLKERAWIDEDVTIVFTDMRVWDAPEKADLMVSELLGSFGDNELSPECLDGAQTFLKADGIMIPKSYTSYIAPIMSPKLYSEVKGHRDADKCPNSHFETPYVVHMHNKYLIAQPQALFTFEHPNNEPVKDNDRYGTRSFNVEQDCVFHGFAGYFESNLFGNVLMSTHPDTHSPGMFSWFPMYFPVREPAYLRESDTVTASFWRKSTKANVWYEWCISDPVTLPIHNSNGKAYNIGLAA